MNKIVSFIFSGRFWFIKLLLLLVLVNILATSFHSRVDLTAEKRFTLSYATKKILRNLKEPVHINVFLSGNLPAGFKQMATSTQDILTEFKEVAGNKLIIENIDPATTVAGTSVSYGDTLAMQGFAPINLTSQRKDGQEQQFVYPYGEVVSANTQVPVVLYKGKTPMINYQEIAAAETLLEYQFAAAIVSATTSTKHVVAYATGNGEPDQLNTYDLVENVLKPNYQLFTINLEAQPFIPAEFELLLIVKPTKPFTDQQKLKLDQFIMHGGRVMFFLDKLNAELDSLQAGEVVAYDRDLKLDDLLFKSGVRINPDLVMDLQCDYLPFDVNGQGQFDLLPWNYFPVMEPSSESSITRGLGYVAGKFVNSLDTIETPGIRKTVLLHTSRNARLIGSPAIISGKENETAPESEKYNKRFIPTAIMLEGSFESLYARRVMQWMKDSLAKYKIDYEESSPSNNKILVVGDADVILNSVVKGNEPLPMGVNPYTYGTQRAFPFANKDFLQNCISYMVDNNGLNESRSKEYVARLLDSRKIETEKQTWQILNIAIPILLILIFAFCYNFWRKKKYS